MTIIHHFMKIKKPIPVSKLPMWMPITAKINGTLFKFIDQQILMGNFEVQLK